MVIFGVKYDSTAIAYLQGVISSWLLIERLDIKVLKF